MFYMQSVLLIALSLTTGNAWTTNKNRCSSSSSLQSEDPVDSTGMDDIPLYNEGIGSRRSFMSLVASAAATATVAVPKAGASPSDSDTYWPNWLALPVFPFDQRKTYMEQVGPRVWTFDQVIGIYYVHVPIRMTVVAMDPENGGGLLVYAPVAATKECLRMLQSLIDQFGPIRTIILPTVAVEHKVLAGPFARRFPDAEFYVTDKQYSFPVNLPDRTLGFPSWTKVLPSSGSSLNPSILNSEFEYEVLTVKPGIGSVYQDVAVWHKPSKTLLVCDALFVASDEPPKILTAIPEYTKALLFHARDQPTDLVEDTPENRRKGWRRIVLLFNFFFPNYSAKVDLGLKPLRELDFSYEYGWAAWMPFNWKEMEKELEAFGRYSSSGKPTIYTIVQIILSRGDSGKATLAWVDKVQQWDFATVIPAHLDSPLALSPKEFSETYEFIRKGKNEVRYCDEDVAFLRSAEEGPLKFSVYPSSLGVLRGQSCDSK